jgi:hypothetical protein
MSSSNSRKIRRAAALQERKLARKGRFQNPETPQLSNTAAAEPAAPAEPEATVVDTVEPIPEPSPARLAANRANGKLSHGALSEATRSISAQNHTIHGLARHRNGTFKLTGCESPENFAALKQSLVDEHQPTTPTEFILVNAMVESHWLSQRAQRLQDTCLNPHSGVITDEKMFSLYLRYFTTHTRAFQKSLNDLLKLRAERRKAEIGFEAQRIAQEKHEMKKQTHYWEVLRKDGEACHQISLNTLENLKARRENPDFESEYAAELAKRSLEVREMEVASKAA